MNHTYAAGEGDSETMDFKSKTCPAANTGGARVHPRTHPRQSTLTRTHMDTSTCARNYIPARECALCMYLCRLPGKFLIKKGWQPRGCLHQFRDRAGEVQSWRVLQVDLLAHTKYPQLSTSTHSSGCKDARAKNYTRGRRPATSPVDK